MKYRARYTPEAAVRIRKLHPEVKRGIREGIRTLLDYPRAGYSLHYELSGLLSFRVRGYRIIYRIDDDSSALEILFVGPRRSIYEEFRDLLLDLRNQS